MAAIDYKAYDQAEVESIKGMLDAESKEGRAISFDVKVNGLTRIHKTNRVERFDELYNFINEHTKELVISIYPDANSNRKEWYKYSFGANNESLNGLDMEQKLNERMQLFEEKQAARRTEEKLEEAQEQIKQAEDYIRILEEKLEASRTKSNHFGEWDLGKLASSTIQGIAVHHPTILEKVPVLNGIAKVIQEDLKNQPAQLSGSFEGDVSFKPKYAKAALSPEAQEHENTIRKLVGFIGERFDDYERRLLGNVIIKLGDDTSQLSPVAELIGLDIQSIKADFENGHEENEEEETED